VTPTRPTEFPPSTYASLRAALAAVDQETLARDQREREDREVERKAQGQQLLRQQEQARAELARLVMRERFGLVTSGIGVAFLVLLVVLPPLPWKWLFYCCALLCIFAGAWQKDYANKRIARVLPKLGVDGVIAMRPQARLKRIRLLWSRLTRRSHNKP